MYKKSIHDIQCILYTYSLFVQLHIHLSVKLLVKCFGKFGFIGWGLEREKSVRTNCPKHITNSGGFALKTDHPKRSSESHQDCGQSTVMAVFRLLHCCIYSMSMLWSALQITPARILQLVFSRLLQLKFSRILWSTRKYCCTASTQCQCSALQIRDGIFQCLISLKYWL